MHARSGTLLPMIIHHLYTLIDWMRVEDKDLQIWKKKKGQPKGTTKCSNQQLSHTTHVGQRFSSWLHCEVYSKCMCSLSSFLDQRNDCTKFCLPCSWKSRQWQIPRFVCHAWQNIKSAMHARTMLLYTDWLNEGWRFHCKDLQKTLLQHYSSGTKLFLGSTIKYTVSNKQIDLNLQPNCKHSKNSFTSIITWLESCYCQLRTHSLQFLLLQQII